MIGQLLEKKEESTRDACKPGIVRAGVSGFSTLDRPTISRVCNTFPPSIEPPSPVPHEDAVSPGFPAPVLTLPAYYLEPDLDAPLICAEQLDRRGRAMVCRDEDGVVVKRIVYRATWCPHGRPFKVARG